MNAVKPPIEPMLAKLADQLPSGDYLYEPKWDGFRALVFRGGDELYLQSRDSRPLDRYFPELHDELLRQLPDGCVVDGEIVIATKKGLDFDALQLRLHPAASRVAKLAKETPASFVGFDLLAAEGRDIRDEPQSRRRARLERARLKPRPTYEVSLDGNPTNTRSRSRSSRRTSRPPASHAPAGRRAPREAIVVAAGCGGSAAKYSLG